MLAAMEAFRMIEPPSGTNGNSFWTVKKRPFAVIEGEFEFLDGQSWVRVPSGKKNDHITSRSSASHYSSSIASVFSALGRLRIPVSELR
jgi:hypothetical protein